MISTVLGPSTIVMMIASGYQEVFHFKPEQLWLSYSLSILPVAIFIVICFKTKPDTQLMVASFLTTFYAVIMVVVIVGISINFTKTDFLNPSTAFLMGMVGFYLLAGLLHPQEFFCLSHGILYLLTIPAAYVLLIVYSLCNLHVVSWGTREVPRKKTQEEKEKEEKEKEEALKKKEERKKDGLFGFLRRGFRPSEVKDFLLALRHGKDEDSMQGNKTVEILESIKGILEKSHGHRREEVMNMEEGIPPSIFTKSEPEAKPAKKRVKKTEPKKITLPTVVRDDLRNPFWIEDEALGDGPVKFLEINETVFWNGFIKKYLKPLKKNKDKEEVDAAALIDLRNSACFCFWFVNFLWLVLNFILMNEPVLNVKLVGLNVQPAGFFFLVFFAVVFILQFIGMVIHRHDTLMHLISITDINWFCRKTSKLLQEHKAKGKLNIDDAVNIVKKLSRPSVGGFEEPPPDYDIDNNDDQSNNSEGIYEELGDDPRRRPPGNMRPGRSRHPTLTNELRRQWENMTQGGQHYPNQWVPRGRHRGEPRRDRYAPHGGARPRRRRRDPNMDMDPLSRNFMNRFRLMEQRGHVPSDILSQRVERRPHQNVDYHFHRRLARAISSRYGSRYPRDQMPVEAPRGYYPHYGV